MVIICKNLDMIAASVFSLSENRELASRHFVDDIPRAEIEGYIAAFPELYRNRKSNVFLEAEDVRYVFYERVFFRLLIITRKQNDIRDDLQRMDAFSSLVTCKSFNIVSNGRNTARNILLLFNTYVERLRYFKAKEVQSKQKDSEMENCNEQSRSKLITQTKIDEISDDEVTKHQEASNTMDMSKISKKKREFMALVSSFQSKINEASKDNITKQHNGISKIDKSKMEKNCWNEEGIMPLSTETGLSH